MTQAIDETTLWVNTPGLHMFKSGSPVALAAVARCSSLLGRTQFRTLRTSLATVIPGSFHVTAKGFRIIQEENRTGFYVKLGPQTKFIFFMNLIKRLYLG